MPNDVLIPPIIECVLLNLTMLSFSKQNAKSMHWVLIKIIPWQFCVIVMSKDADQIEWQQ